MSKLLNTTSFNLATSCSGLPHPQYPAATLQYNPAAFSAVASSPQFSTQKKRTLVQYKYPDILHTSDNKNQNYYV